MIPMRILQVVTITNRGGLETMLMNYYRSIDRNKIQFDFLVHREERGDYDDEIEALGGKIFRACPIRPGNYRRYFRFIDNFLNEHSEYEVIHSHIQENSGFILHKAKQQNIPVRIAHSHIAALGLDYKFIFRQYARLYLKHSTTHNFACGEEAGKWLFNNQEYKVLNNAIDASEFEYSQSIRAKMKLELDLQSSFVIGHVGRFNPQKNHSFLIDIFNEVHKQNNKAVLLLIGTGEDQDKIREKVKKLNLSHSVRFLNLRNDIPRIMQAMDVFLFPSLYEGLPVAVIEAQASGLKCILSNTIAAEAAKTDLVEFISLKKSPQYWAEQVLKYQPGYARKSMYQEMVKTGYEVKENAKWLQQFYLSRGEFVES